MTGLGSSYCRPQWNLNSSQKFQKRFWNANVATSKIGFVEAYQVFQF